MTLDWGRLRLDLEMGLSLSPTPTSLPLSESAKPGLPGLKQPFCALGRPRGGQAQGPLSCCVRKGRSGDGQVDLPGSEIAQFLIFDICPSWVPRLSSPNPADMHPQSRSSCRAPSSDQCGPWAWRGGSQIPLLGTWEEPHSAHTCVNRCPQKEQHQVQDSPSECPLSCLHTE